ncbi:GntR family transcriptional regulator [Devosia sp. A16]|uniref:GntR family transcriptional regulator n=1 Tax=Devosia sp. A16 TaxID=1736675 RepID=UPI0006D85176|nr:GntR family transcriptional regulator [Devosia sp. A16]
MRGEIENAGYAAFFDALIAGKLKLGQTLTQEELCKVLGLSLSPMRETTTLLEAEGLITVRRKVGITIFYPDVKFVGNCFQFRGLLEREGLRKFAQTVTPAWIDAMRDEHYDIIDFVRQTNDMERYRVPVKLLERKFHDTFVAAFENDQISVNYARLTQKMYLLRLHNLNAVGPANTVTSMEEHLVIIDALKAGDVEAACDGLDRHLQGVLHRVLTT